jgi:hypothetical protein
MLGEDEELLWDQVINEMESEDGCLWIYGTRRSTDHRIHRPWDWNISRTSSESTTGASDPRPIGKAY